MLLKPIPYLAGVCNPNYGRVDLPHNPWQQPSWKALAQDGQEPPDDGHELLAPPVLVQVQPFLSQVRVKVGGQTVRGQVAIQGLVPAHDQKLQLERQRSVSASPSWVRSETVCRSV
jgi:hypothetical protein